MLIKHLPINTAGRDFVCGDIHGCYDRVISFLRHINFDVHKDRFIAAGDLVDRGPMSLECLTLLYEPWFFTVKGNHDLMMQEAFTGHPGWEFIFVRNGGAWAQQYIHGNDEDSYFVRNTVETITKQLPLLITVEMSNSKKFHVLHAEIMCKEELNDEVFADEEVFSSLATIQTIDGDHVLWGRSLFQNLNSIDLTPRNIEKVKRGALMANKHLMFGPNLSHIYSGHTIVKKPVQFFGQTNLDTQAFGSYSQPNRYNDGDPPDWAGLTVTEPLTNKFWLVTRNEVKSTQPIIITKEPENVTQ